MSLQNVRIIGLATASLVENLRLQGLPKGQKAYLRVIVDTLVQYVRIYADAAYTQLLAESVTAGTDAVVEERNASGVSGLVDADFTDYTAPEDAIGIIPLYDLNDTARMRAYESLLWNIGTIKAVNGYATTIGDVFRSLSRRADTINFPAVILLKGDEFVTNVTNDSEDLGDDALHKVFNFTALCYLKPESMTTEQIDDFVDQMLADFETLLGNNWQLGDQNGAWTCRLALVTGSEPFVKLLDQNFNGIAIRIRVRYSQDIHDPAIAV